MPCFHPLPAFYTGNFTKNGKREVKIVPRDVVSNAALDSKLWQSDRAFWLPCGQCIGCRLERSRQWANRCILELEYHDSAYFVTLTYDDDHVPQSWYADESTGEAVPVQTLRKKDFQAFMKRLRFHFGQGIRFFACGEYGPETWRPHYHAIIFGLKLDDLIPWSKSPQGNQYYLSSSLQQVWSIRKAPTRYGSVNCLTADPEFFYDPIGHILVSEVTWETCAYVARYCTKKLTGDQADFYPRFGLEPPFSLMSNRPGLARQWYDDHPDCYDFEYINVSTPKGGRKFRPPRYFDKLYDIDYPDRMAEIKKSRKLIAEAAQAAKLASTHLSVDEILSLQEETCLSRIKTLQRKL